MESGGKVQQETRLFDPDRGETRSMRSKEEAHDYRYFPEPDLPPLVVEDALVEEVRRTLPELPRARAARYQKELGLSAYDAGLLTADKAVAEFFDSTLSVYGRGPEAAKRVANWLNGEVARLANETGLERGGVEAHPGEAGRDPGPRSTRGRSAAPAPRQVLERGLPHRRATRRRWSSAKGLAQVSDEGAIEAAVDRVLAANPAEVEKYRAGKKNLVGFFVGQVMKEMKGKGNPGLVNALLRKKLGE